MTEPSRPIERLADALQACLNEAAEKAVAKMEPRFQGFEGCLNEAAERGAEKAAAKMEPRFQGIEARLDRQGETLRLIWRQVKGNGSLPIDG